MAVRIEDIHKAIAEVIGSFDGVKEVTAQQREGIVNYIRRKDIMLFLTVVDCEIGRNRYFAGTDQRTGSGCLVGIMGNLSYK